MQKKSHARHDQSRLIDPSGSQRLRELIHFSPRTFRYETSIWTQPLLAEQLYQEHYTPYLGSPSNINLSPQRVENTRRRAKNWLGSPDPHYEHRNKYATS